MKKEGVQDKAKRRNNRVKRIKKSDSGKPPRY